MNKLARRWIGMLIFSVVMASLFISLGRWQWHKHVERSASNAIITANRAKPVQQFPAMFSTSHTITDGEQWQRVQVTGVYDDQQFQAMQRSTATATSGSVFGSFGADSTAGTEVITPLRTASGLTVLVDRGLMPRQPGHNDSSALPPPPSGTVTVTGFVRRDEHGKESATTPVNRQMLLINAPAIGQQLGLSLVDGFIQLDTSSPAQSGNLIVLAQPQTSGGPYLSYAIQWFMFTLIGVVGMVMIVRGDLRARHRSERRERIAAMRAANARVSASGTSGARPAADTGAGAATDTGAGAATGGAGATASTTDPATSTSPTHENGSGSTPHPSDPKDGTDGPRTH